MENANNLINIPAEKFKFARKTDFDHDAKFATKPVSYFQGAFRRFCKNKGAVVASVIILVLVLFAIIAPFCTPYTVGYSDEKFSGVRPKNKLFADTNFWDGCVEYENVGYLTWFKDYSLGLETGRNAIKNGEYVINDDGTYTYRHDTYYSVAFGKYTTMTLEEYEDIQKYQLAKDKQVIYPTVHPEDRPSERDFKEYHNDASIYYKTEKRSLGGKKQLYPVLDGNGNLILNYWSYGKDEELPMEAAAYNSKRIAGDGESNYYVYGLKKSGDTVECRVDYYEYYIYKHTWVLNDGIEEPYFLFGTTAGAETAAGKDIFVCLASGARFSFLFAIAVASINLFVGAIWGSVSGYFGGKVDILMERFTDVLGAVPTMIVISLLKFHMGTTSQAIILFIAFFATGWIGMAGTTRMQFYRYKNQEYVLAARTLGANDKRIMFKHIFPNAIGTLVTSCALVIPSMIYSETNLSYLGIINLEGDKVTSVGTLISVGQSQMTTAPYMALFPTCFLVLLMLSFNLFGNGLRDAFNPSLRGAED